MTHQHGAMDIFPHLVKTFIDETDKRNYKEACRNVTFEKNMLTLLATPVLQVPRILIIKTSEDRWEAHHSGNLLLPSEANPKYHSEDGFDFDSFKKDVEIICDGMTKENHSLKGSANNE